MGNFEEEKIEEIGYEKGNNQGGEQIWDEQEDAPFDDDNGSEGSLDD
eukprot:CAMPEP_0114576766 /NCGR_PEP_ID=MMETSP0125-20121206/1495_1 /TAXON_ID=485358 ORGANISM="Aristerostoma sp., Strain ATCC 50986" /NCGR_SAMPLE_ID=MMETSP0125 /ASSEMBLY_ACC=CAM_ASM_000245 /LENGTH=46 /DNA_ID= /DNA_START= /DNA_END= /DNA_ORIENTATION=